MSTNPARHDGQPAIVCACVADSPFGEQRVELVVDGLRAGLAIARDFGDERYCCKLRCPEYQ
jgi:hypothetical protein